MKPRYPSRLPARGTDADTTAQRALDATEGVDRFYPPASESSASSGRSSGLHDTDCACQPLRCQR